jgi:hypothetical protein
VLSNMANNVVAYVGMDYSDYILYTARILLRLGMKVLLVDHSDTLSLKNSIPEPKGLCSNTDIITYRGLDFTTSSVSLEMLKQYDDILIAYGFRKPAEDIGYCGRVVFVTDLYRYNHSRLREYSINHHLNKIAYKELIIKEAIETKITTDIISERIGIRFSPENITVLFRDDKDYYNGVICHTNNSIYFTHVSKQLKRHLIQETKVLYPNIKAKQLTAACNRAGKGEM